MTPINIDISGETFEAHLDESKSPKTVKKIIEALPLETTVNSWGKEFYFRIPVHAEAENAVDKVSVGDLGFWPRGKAFCIFFGKTPMSDNEDEIIPASPVNLIGRIDGVERLKEHKGGESVRISLAGE